jgi:hypothetical protein
VGADGGSLVLNANVPISESLFGEGLDYTTSENGNVFLKAIYAYSN